jgi:hypothetical protein
VGDRNREHEHGKINERELVEPEHDQRQREEPDHEAAEHRRLQQGE